MIDRVAAAMLIVAVAPVAMVLVAVGVVAGAWGRVVRR